MKNDKSMNRRSFLRADRLLPEALIASPFFERAMTTLRSDRRMLILAGSDVNYLVPCPGDRV